ncbi:MAG: Fe-S-cluster-containing hydrogenase [Thermoanaerobaculaceae bacterium]|nr:Fe-S-cluster-containing hydrogenase [Thermoanaerobaculaceae bacterium]
MGRDYWRSLEELAGQPGGHPDPELVAWLEEVVPPASRRHFLKLMGASLGLAGLTSCRWPRELIVPFAKRPEDRTPGVPQQFATIMEMGGAALGLLVTSFDGRPTKVEGNPLHPASLGGTHLWAQASILELYDPDRSRQVLHQGKPASWDELAAYLQEHRGNLGTGAPGGGLAVVAGATSSPTLAALGRRLKQAGGLWIEHEAWSWRNQAAAAAMLGGTPGRWVLNLDRARVVVCLDADILLAHPDAVRHARDFASTRRGGEAQGRLYAAEAALSLTGAAADHRLPVPARQVGVLALHLLAEVARLGVVVPPALLGQWGAVKEVAGLPPTGALPELPEPCVGFVRAVAKDLVAHRGACLVVAGAGQTVAHHLALVLNQVLGNLGSTVSLVPHESPATDAAARMAAPFVGGGLTRRLLDPVVDGLDELVGGLESRSVSTVLILGDNPALEMPRFAEELKRPGVTSLHLGLYADETAKRCTWHLPQAHFLESWGDGRAWDGTYAVQQPLIAPLHGGRSAIEVLSSVLEATPPSAHDLVKRTFTELHRPADPELAWQQALRDGVVIGSAPAASATSWPSHDSSLVPAWQAAVEQARAGSDGDLDAVLVPDSRVWDGRFANNAWLQELPDPLSKLTWDNAAVLGPETAGTLGVRHGDVVKLTRGTTSVEAPVYVMPGVAAGSVVLPLGGGRTAAGQVGNGVGFDAYPLRPDGQESFAGGLKVERTGRRHLLATTQDHHDIDRVGFRGRELRVGELVRERKVGEAPAGEAGAGHGEHAAIFHSPELSGEHQWAMAIDLAACTGCSVCTLACQAENNIVVVGKTQVARSRERAWLRLDRYFSGAPGNPRVHFAPVACQHCEKAPCEQVCPVAATIHSDEGLNQMVYNRCVGTRYCSNNCPFKVRRFNFFHYTKEVGHLRRMAFNPEVTVRSRGVMEKCTYCIQRIEHAKIAAKNERRELRDGEVVPACAQACPAGAIVFGDLSDPGSRVAALHREGRAYVMLPELDIAQRTRYLARLVNPSPDLEEA